MANEAVSQDPAYLEDIARATLGSMMTDLMEGKTASRYTPLNEIVIISFRKPCSKKSQVRKSKAK
jgi:hypothetical protein